MAIVAECHMLGGWCFHVAYQHYHRGIQLPSGHYLDPGRPRSAPIDECQYPQIQVRPLVEFPLLECH